MSVSKPRINPKRLSGRGEGDTSFSHQQAVCRVELTLVLARYFGKPIFHCADTGKMCCAENCKRRKNE